MATTDPGSFFSDGSCNDAMYAYIRDNSRAGRHKQFIETLWRQCFHLVGSDIRMQAREQFHDRFWEMYLAVTLLKRGFELQRHSGEGPDFYANIGNHRIWFEATAPGAGTGENLVPEQTSSVIAMDIPTEKILLRFTSTLSEKQKQYRAALEKGIISQNDSYVLAINSSKIPHAAFGNTMPYFIQAFLPVGPLTLVYDTNPFVLQERFYAYRPYVMKDRKGKEPERISTSMFLDSATSFCSAVLHSSAHCGSYYPDYVDKYGDEFVVLHNPMAKSPIESATFSWCEQCRYRDGQLAKILPSNSGQPASL